MKPPAGPEAADATLVEKRRSGMIAAAEAQDDEPADDAASEAEVDDELSDHAEEGGAALDPTAHAAAPAPEMPATVVDAAAQGLRSAVAVSTHDTHTLTPDVALRHDEIARTRAFLRIAIVLATMTTALIPLMPASGVPRALSIGGGFTVMVTCLAYLIYIRHDARFTVRSLMVTATIAVIAVQPVVWSIGIYSPSPIVYTLGIYFFSLGGSKAGTWSIYIAVSLLHMAPAALAGAGVIDDPGLITADSLDLRTRVIFLALVQAVFFLTFRLARISRAATRSAIARLHGAILQVQKREALLAEAHQDLDRALKAGYQGRHTDRRLGPWILGEVIGRGAMGEVYRGTHEASKLVAAVKVLHPDVAAQPAHVRRFLREAEIVSQVQSPHVVKVLDVGTTEPGRTDRDMPYLAMELLDGHDLAWHLRRKRRLSMRRVVELVDQVAHALTAAVARDVVHRDLKPQNLFFTRIHGDAARAGERLWKVLDFGVSKLSSGSGTLTQGAVVGTPGYMAPEQARGGEVGPTADVFALAAIAYRVLTGRPPFSGPDMPKVLFDVCYRQPVKPSGLARIPEDVERVLAIGLAKSAEERFQSARQLADALRAATEGELPPELRRRAEALLRAMPWNARGE